MNAEQTAIYNRYKSICEAAYAADQNWDNTDTMYAMAELATTMAIDYLKSKGLWDCPEDEDESEWLSVEKPNDPLWVWMDAFNDVLYEDDDEEEDEEDEEVSTPSEDEKEKSDDPC